MLTGWISAPVALIGVLVKAHTLSMEPSRLGFDGGAVHHPHPFDSMFGRDLAWQILHLRKTFYLDDL
jgi:hypothetical protein